MSLHVLGGNALFIIHAVICSPSMWLALSVMGGGAVSEEAESRQGEEHLSRSYSKASPMGYFTEAGESIVSVEKKKAG